MARTPRRPQVVDKDLGWKELLRRARAVRNSYVRVGVLGDDSKGAERPEGSDLTVAEIAAINEFGTDDGHVPSRPAFRHTFDAKRAELVELGKKLMRAYIDGKMPIDRALGILGSTLASEIKKTITQWPLPGFPPPNAPSTVRAKQRDKPGMVRTLVDTGRMVGAITWSVVVRE